MLSLKNRGYIANYDVDIFNGTERKSFFGTGQEEFPNAHIRSGKLSDVVVDRRTAPLLLIYRAVDGDLAQFDPELLTITELHDIHESRECWLIKSEKKRNRGASLG